MQQQVALPLSRLMLRHRLDVAGAAVGAGARLDEARNGPEVLELTLDKSGELAARLLPGGELLLGSGGAGVARL